MRSASKISTNKHRGHGGTHTAAPPPASSPDTTFHRPSSSSQTQLDAGITSSPTSVDMHQTLVSKSPSPAYTRTRTSGRSLLPRHAADDWRRRTTLCTVATALVSSRLDYANSTPFYMAFQLNTSLVSSAHKIPLHVLSRVWLYCLQLTHFKKTPLAPHWRSYQVQNSHTHL